MISSDRWSIGKDVHSKFLARRNLEPIHRHTRNFSILVCGIFNNCMAFVTILLIFGKLYAINFTEWLKELLNILLGKCSQCSIQATDVDPVILLST